MLHLDEPKEKLSDCGEEAPLVSARRSRMRGLRDFSLVTYLTDHDYQRVGVDPKAAVLDLRHVAAWTLALQVVGACVVMTSVSIAVPHALPFEGRNAVRVLVASALTAALLLARPVLVVNPNQMATMAPPLRHVNKSLRACAFFVLGCWACESLIYTECGDTEMHVIHSLRHAFLVIAFLGISIASCFRAVFPTSTSDVHTAAALVFLVMLVCTPQSQSYAHNPLSRPLPFSDAMVRMTRVLLFSVTYTAAVLAAAPLRIFELDPLVLCTRAFAATAWILACPPQLLACQPFFLAGLCMRRVRINDAEAATVVLDGVYADNADDIDIEEHNAQKATHVDTNTLTKATLTEDRKRVLLSRLTGAS